jgi:hypothetical protein
VIFGLAAHQCEQFGIKPLHGDISRPPPAGPVPLVSGRPALGGHLPAQEHRQADKEGDADHQGRSERGEILPHSRVLSVKRPGQATGQSTGSIDRANRPGQRTGLGRPGPAVRAWPPDPDGACIVSPATPVLIFPIR